MNGEQVESADYLKQEQEKTLLIMDENRHAMAVNTEATLAIQMARARVRIRLSGCAVALTVLVWAVAIFCAVRFG